VGLSPRIQRVLKIPLAILCLAALSGALLWFGGGGFARLFDSEAERQAYIERIHKLAQENEALLNEVDLLRTDPAYLETVARRELNLVKEKEVLYRFENDSNRSADDLQTSNPTVEPNGKE